MGVTLVYALATDVFRLERYGSRIIYVTALACLGVAMAVRLARLRRERVRVLIATLPREDRGQESKYLAWLFGAAALGAYSVYEAVAWHSLVFAAVCAFSTVLMVVLGVGLTRQGSARR